MRGSDVILKIVFYGPVAVCMVIMLVMLLFHPAGLLADLILLVIITPWYLFGRMVIKKCERSDRIIK